MGLHCHQPVDNFSFVVDDAIKKSYLPFFQVLQEYPQIKISVHYSGWLLEYIKDNAPELFSLMQSLSSQIEFFTGGYYEPILSSISSEDIVAQINKLSKFIATNFGQNPRGLWLTERVWDSSLIKYLKRCNIEYVIIDDYHLISSGYKLQNYNSYYLSENGGETIALFPINQKLRYMIPFAPVSEVVAELESYESKESQNAAIIFDDGEKFGIWPKTYELVYEKGWLREFFTNLCSSKRVQSSTFYDYYTQNKPAQLVYLENCSYKEMGEWVLDVDNHSLYEEISQKYNNDAIIKGGSWKKFLSKYQESNWIHKRVQHLSKKRCEDANYKENIYKAQCNDVLWHGVFGGIYLPNLRDNAYRYILACENQLYYEPKVEICDIDCNGYSEYCYHSDNLVVIISTKNGGQIFELGIKDSGFNLQNTMTRYKESYHKKIEFGTTVDEDESKTIHENSLVLNEEVAFYYDWYLKKSAIDHISDTSFTLENFEKTAFVEYGDFVNQPYEVANYTKKKLHLQREGGIYLQNQYNATILKKHFKIKKNKIALDVQLATHFENELCYINEWNLHFCNVEKLFFNGAKVLEPISIYSDTLTIDDYILNKRVSFEFEDKIDIYIVPIKTYSQSESGVDSTIQGVSIAFKQNFIKEFEFVCEFKIESL